MNECERSRKIEWNRERREIDVHMRTYTFHSCQNVPMKRKKNPGII